MDRNLPVLSGAFLHHIEKVRCTQCRKLVCSYSVVCRDHSKKNNIKYLFRAVISGDTDYAFTFWLDLSITWSYLTCPEKLPVFPLFLSLVGWLNWAVLCNFLYPWELSVSLMFHHQTGGTPWAIVEWGVHALVMNDPAKSTGLSLSPEMTAFPWKVK